MRLHGIWAITCPAPCGRYQEIRDTELRAVCPDCGREQEIAWDQPMTVEAPEKIGYSDLSVFLRTMFAVPYSRYEIGFCC